MCEPYQTTSNRKPLPHWPHSTDLGKGNWRDYYTSEKLGDFPKPFLPTDKFTDDDRCLVLRTSWRDNNWVIPFNTSWTAKICSGSWRMCPCQTNDLPAVLNLRGLCRSSVLRTKYPAKGLLYTPTQHTSLIGKPFFAGGMSTTIRYLREGLMIRKIHNLPNLPNQTYQSKPPNPNLPIQTYQTKSNLVYQAL